MLKIENLYAGYNEVTVLNDINLNIPMGHTISIVGVNAAGKSTLVNTICGLVQPKSGKLLFKDRDISKLKPYERTRMGIVQVPEGRKLFPDLTVKENLLVASTFSKAKKERHSRIDYVFNLFPRLKERESQIASTMSGGEQQMLAIGRALMCSPELLILDEPSLGLAPIIVSQIFDVIRELKKQGLTVLLIEQNVRHALQICDYGYVIEHGRIALEGEGQALIDNPKTKEAYLGR
ncbi:ABC transporter ATP-binding protein [Neobacillus sp. 114]|uniref:ABC transporter ATP-binding protein n=1 Tax=Neobacillus sp. 114 TaxID=3048535 RepID=UPI001C23CE08|nr:ABC transporter ATP-binding protein [Neobacillus sp. 114]MBU8918843.1 ABC transporter ATP-binding protein [Bacillus sp. FJAT-29953]